MPESELELKILTELRKIVLDIKPSTEDDLNRVECEINSINSKAVYETSEDMRNYEKDINLLSL